ncbi:MAG: RluA family pseudouridine synthase [Cytophagales bacterium]|nr:RluA family pseudouridine synthase [Cytophagales bacterium]
METSLRFSVDPGQEPLRLDKFLVQRIKQTTRNRIQRSILEGRVQVNGKAIFSSSKKIQGGDFIHLELPSPIHKDPFSPKPQNIPIEVVYEDDSVLVVNKEAGMVVHPAHGHWEGTLLNAVAHHLGYDQDDAHADSGILAEDSLYRLGLVHRIDKDTSGLLVIAKTRRAQLSLNEQWTSQKVFRKYLALVWGVPDPAEGSLTKSMGRDPRNRQKMTTFGESEGGKKACTHYRILKNFHYTCLVECRLETGRTHQVRVHMEDFGHPIFGDPVYGGASVQLERESPRAKLGEYRAFVRSCLYLLPRQALHAESLAFRHPETGQPCEFFSSPPRDMQEVLDKWEEFLLTQE